MEISKLICEDHDCDWKGDSETALHAPDPFNEGCELTACPECRQQTLRFACDEPSCWDLISCAIPTPNGYREHATNIDQTNNTMFPYPKIDRIISKEAIPLIRNPCFGKLPHHFVDCIGGIVCDQCGVLIPNDKMRFKVRKHAITPRTTV